MKKKELIEKLEDLATYFTLAASDAGKDAKRAKDIANFQGACFREGRETAYKTAFNKVDSLIKEAKR